MKKWIILLVSSWLLAACQSGAPEINPDDQPDPYFDLKGYFEKETARLNREQPRLRKQVSINEETEEKMLDSLDYEQELSVFINSDINRPAWFDKYRIDSLRDGARLQTLSYQALDKDLRVRSIRIRFTGDEVSEIIIDKETENIVAGSGQHLEYRPDQGYQISSRQKTAVSKKQELNISVRFLD